MTRIIEKSYTTALELFTKLKDGIRYGFEMRWRVLLVEASFAVDKLRQRTGVVRACDQCPWVRFIG